MKDSVPHLKDSRGRGADHDLPNRFERLHLDLDPDVVPSPEEEDVFLPRPQTQFYEDATESIVTSNRSPDIGFEKSLNPYRGCEHGCAYCYARPTHEYLGFSAGFDFESKIVVKPRAAELLREALASPRWKPTPLAMSGVTDCYQPVERKLRITRACLQVLAEFKNPVGIITKNYLVTRDCDLLKILAADGAASVHLSLTTLNPKLARCLEPRASSPAFRLKAIRRLRAAGVPVSVSLSPMIPGLNDHEISDLLEAAADAGAEAAFSLPLRLPLSVAPVFVAWLERHYPERKEKVLALIRGMRGGKLNQSSFEKRFQAVGAYASSVQTLFEVQCQRLGLRRESRPLSVDRFRRPSDRQMELW